MSSKSPSPATVREVISDIAPPGTPLTTAEVAAEFDCTTRTIYNKLDALVDDGVLKTKKVGARGRVWWRPTGERGRTATGRHANREWASDSVSCTYGTEAVRRLEEERDMFADGPVVVFRWTPDAEAGWPVEYVTENVEAMLGYTAEEFTSGAVQYTDLLLDEEIDRIAREVTENTDSAADRFTHEPYRVKTRSGDVRWVKDVTKIVRDDSGDVVNYLGYLIDITERKQNEEHQRFLIDLSDTFRALTDPDEIKTAAAELLGSELGLSQVGFVTLAIDQETAVVGGEYSDGDVPVPSGHTFTFSDYPASYRSALQSGESLYFDGDSAAQPSPDDCSDVPDAVGEQASVAVPIKRDGRLVGWLYASHPGSRSWPEHERRLIQEVAERTWDAFERAQAKVELRRTNDALESLNTASTELIDAEPETFSDRVAAVTGTVLDAEHVTVWRYSTETGELRKETVSTGSETGATDLHCPDAISDLVWQTFLSSEVRVEDDLELDGTSTAPSLRSCLLVPLGRHGVICAGSTTADRFDRQTADLAETFAATVEAAWDRAEGEQQLAERNEQLHHLDRLNDLIRDVIQALVDADNVDAIDEAVCEQLAASEQYEFAWIGERDVATGTITPREWAGVDSGYVETLAIETDDSQTEPDPIAAALHTQELQVVSDVAVDPRAAAWREATLKRGARSCIAIPLVYNGSRYGVLSVYTDTPQPDDREYSVLAELGETIAHAIDAAETKRTLLSDTVTELVLEVQTSDDVLTALAQATGGEIEFDSLVPRDDETRLFFSVSGVAVEELRTAAREYPSIKEISVLRDDDVARVFEATVTEPTIASRAVDNQGFIRSLTATEDGATLVVDLPATVIVREFVEHLQDTYPGTDLAKRRRRDRPIMTQQDLHDAVMDRLTNRQREVIETAYRSGFFESPRVRTGNELAETLDVTQSTFSYHLREAERRLSQLVFENA